MRQNENPALRQDRVSCVSFGERTQEALTLSAYRAQYVMNKFGVRSELAVMLGVALFGEVRHG